MKKILSCLVAILALSLVLCLAAGAEGTEEFETVTITSEELDVMTATELTDDMILTSHAEPPLTVDGEMSTPAYTPDGMLTDVDENPVARDLEFMLPDPEVPFYDRLGGVIVDEKSGAVTVISVGLTDGEKNEILARVSDPENVSFADGKVSLPELEALCEEISRIYANPDDKLSTNPAFMYVRAITENNLATSNGALVRVLFDKSLFDDTQLTNVNAELAAKYAGKAEAVSETIYYATTGVPEIGIGGLDDIGSIDTSAVAVKPVNEIWLPLVIAVVAALSLGTAFVLNRRAVADTGMGTTECEPRSAKVTKKEIEGEIRKNDAAPSDRVYHEIEEKIDRK